jgi:hypothetical protein
VASKSGIDQHWKTCQISGKQILDLQIIEPSKSNTILETQHTVATPTLSYSHLQHDPNLPQVTTKLHDLSNTYASNVALPSDPAIVSVSDNDLSELCILY